MAEIEKEIECGDDYLVVEFFTTKSETRNNSIGSFEFWGQCGYDNQSDYTDVTDFSCKRADFSDFEQKVIDSYAKENRSEICDLLSEKENEYWDNYEPEYERD